MLLFMAPAEGPPNQPLLCCLENKDKQSHMAGTARPWLRDNLSGTLGQAVKFTSVFQKYLPVWRDMAGFFFAKADERLTLQLARMTCCSIKRELLMQSVLKLARRGEVAALAIAAAAVGVMAMASPALAGADATFDTALNQFTGFLEGSGGKIITVLSLAGGIVGLASGRFSLAQVAIPVGVGVGAGTGIPIVTSTVTATI